MRLRAGVPPGRGLTLLCLGAHCDDIEIGCGGTVLRLLEEHPGSDVHWAVLTSTPERELETRSAAGEFLAAAGDSTVTVHAFRDSYLPSQWPEVKDAFEKLKLEVVPDLVLTHAAADAHQDHRVVSELTWNTFRDQLVLEYEIPKYDGDLGRPNVYVPLTAELVERKVGALMRCYASQQRRRWFDPETFRSILRIRGMECNAPEHYAEAFHGRKLVL